MFCKFKHCFTIKKKRKKREKKGKASYIQSYTVDNGFHSSKQIQPFHIYLLRASQNSERQNSLTVLYIFLIPNLSYNRTHVRE